MEQLRDEKRCTICGRGDRLLHGGRHRPMLWGPARYPLLVAEPQDMWVQRYRHRRPGWVLCKAGSLLCLDHPRLSAAFEPEEAITPSNPRWQEFTERLNSRLRAVQCKAGRDKAQATAVLQEMGISGDLMSANLAYFESHGGFCDCEIIYNIAMVHPQRRSLKWR